MPEALLPETPSTLDQRSLSGRDRRLAEAGVRLPRNDLAGPMRFAGRRRPRWLAMLIRLFS
jgi:hypothetical protein